MREVARRVSSDLVAGIRETARIENGRIVRCGGMVGKPRGKLRAHHIGPLVAIRESGVREPEVDGRSRLKRQDGGDGPTAYQCVEHTIHVSANPAVPSNRNVSNCCEHHSMGRVVGTDRMFCLEVVQLLRIPRTQALCDERVRSRRRIVRSLRKSVVSFKTNVVAGTLLKSHLERMVSRACRELRESAERAIKLGERTQQVDGWEFVIVIEGVRFVKNRVRPLKKRLKRIGNETIDKSPHCGPFPDPNYCCQGNPKAPRVHTYLPAAAAALTEKDPRASRIASENYL